MESPPLHELLSWERPPLGDPLLCRTAKAPSRAPVPQPSLLAVRLLSCRNQVSSASVVPSHRSAPFCHSTTCPMPTEQSRTIAIFYGQKCLSLSRPSEALRPSPVCPQGQAGPPSSEQAMPANLHECSYAKNMLEIPSSFLFLNPFRAQLQSCQSCSRFPPCPELLSQLLWVCT